MKQAKIEVIKLTQGKFAKVDKEDFVWLSQWKWHYKRGSPGHRGGYAGRRVGKNIILMHREINRTPVGKLTDHINRDGLDNRKSNLRTCNSGESNINRKLPKNNTSGYRGVVYNKGRSKWSASIVKNKKRIHLGYFLSKQEAHLVRDKMAPIYHGKFACVGE